MLCRVILSVFCVIFVCFSKTDAIDDKTLTGKITYAGSIKLHADYQIEISLNDISRMDAPSITIASTIISNVTSFPISYVLKYKPSDIKLTNHYSISARITKPDGTLAFTTDFNIRIDFEHETNAPIDIAVIEGDQSKSKNN